MKTIISDENEFWISYEDAVSKFVSLNVCKTEELEEIRLKGKFLKIEDSKDDKIQSVVSKWFYSIDVLEKTRVIVGLH